MADGLPECYALLKCISKCSPRRSSTVHTIYSTEAGTCYRTDRIVSGCTLKGYTVHTIYSTEAGTCYRTDRIVSGCTLKGYTVHTIYSTEAGTCYRTDRIVSGCTLKGYSPSVSDKFYDK